MVPSRFSCRMASSKNDGSITTPARAELARRSATLAATVIGVTAHPSSKHRLVRVANSQEKGLTRGTAGGDVHRGLAAYCTPALPRHVYQNVRRRATVIASSCRTPGRSRADLGIQEASNAPLDGRAFERIRVAGFGGLDLVITFA